MNLTIEKDFPQLRILSHPLVRHKMTILRDKNTTTKDFREVLNELATILAYEATAGLPLKEHHIETPLMPHTAAKLIETHPVVVPILRAGLGMVEGFLRIMPTARVGHIGLYRDEETHQPHNYYFKIPANSKRSHYFVCDPMLATGGSASDAITELKDRGIEKITFMCCIAAPEGVKALTTAHPDLPIYCGQLDKRLNDNCFILPGLGDAGDRLFGTFSA